MMSTNHVTNASRCPCVLVGDGSSRVPLRIPFLLNTFSAGFRQWSVLCYVFPLCAWRLCQRVRVRGSRHHVEGPSFLFRTPGARRVMYVFLRVRRLRRGSEAQESL